MTNKNVKKALASSRRDRRSKATQEALSRLRTAAKTSRDTPSARVLVAISRDIQSAGIATLETARELLAEGSASAIELALLILPVSSKTHRAKCLDIIVHYADSANWEIREYAADSLGSLLRFHFQDLSPKLRLLRKSPSANVRRAVVVGLKYLAKYRDAATPEEVLISLEPFMDDSEDYVRKNLGPFAIGDAILAYHPKETIAFLRNKVTHTDPTVRWNVAAAFTTAVGARHFAAAQPLLAKLVRDKDASVRRVALKALRIAYQRDKRNRATIAALVKRARTTIQLPAPMLRFVEDRQRAAK